MVGDAGLGIQPGMTSSQWTLGWDPQRATRNGGVISAALKKKPLPRWRVLGGGGGEGRGGDDHWAVVLKISEPPATGVHLMSLQPVQ